MIHLGDTAPNFTLRASDKSETSLDDYNGQRLLLLFFPLAFTSVCTEELCTMRDDLSVYTDLNTKIIAISVDSLFCLAAFKKAQNYPFPLLSDFNKVVSRAYGCLYEDFVLDMRGVAKRAAFLVDEKGIIRYAEVLASAGDQPNYQAIKETLQAL